MLLLLGTWGLVGHYTYGGKHAATRWCHLVLAPTALCASSRISPRSTSSPKCRRKSAPMMGMATSARSKSPPTGCHVHLAVTLASYRVPVSCTLAMTRCRLL